MPLIKGGSLLEINHETDPEIMEGESYWILAEVSWFDMEKMKDDQAVKVNLPPEVIKMIQSGEGNAAELIAQHLQAGVDMAELKLNQLAVMLQKWSHKQAINKQTISHLDPVTVRVLFRRIREVIAASRERGSANGPLSNDSINSSESPSEDTEVG